MPAIRPRGMSRLGSRVSSAARGTPSMARKNQMPNTKDDSTPLIPNGRKLLAPAASVAGMSVRFDASNFGIIPTTKTSSATTAIAVMTNITLSASPTPKMWMPTKTA